MRMKRAFTLVEVSVAILVMASGIMGMVSLYSLGLRENRQSVEDVATAGFADAVFAPLVAGLSARDLKWQDWCDAVPNKPSASGNGVVIDCNGLLPEAGQGTGKGPGWAAYVRDVENGRDYLVDAGGSGNATARGVYNAIRSAAARAPSANGLAEFPRDIGNGGYYCGLVATRRGSTISLAFRASIRLQQLFAAPVYYTEVHFQGVSQ